MATKKINYNAINFKNKDVDKFSTKFNNGPGDGLIATVRGMGKQLKQAPANTKDVESWKTLQKIRSAESDNPLGYMTATLTDKEQNSLNRAEKLKKKFTPAEDKRSEIEKMDSESKKKK